MSQRDELGFEANVVPSAGRYTLQYLSLPVLCILDNQRAALGGCVRVEAGIPAKHSIRAFAAALLLDPSETDLVATGNRDHLSP